MKNVSEMNNGSLHSIILCFLSIVQFLLRLILQIFPPVVLEEPDMKKNDLFAVVIVEPENFLRVKPRAPRLPDATSVRHDHM